MAISPRQAVIGSTGRFTAQEQAVIDAVEANIDEDIAKTGALGSYTVDDIAAIIALLRSPWQALTPAMVAAVESRYVSLGWKTVRLKTDFMILHGSIAQWQAEFPENTKPTP